MSAENNSITSVIRDLVIANRVLANEDILDDFGHISVRHPHDPQRYFLSRSRSPEVVTVDDIVEYTLDGEPTTPSTERPYAERALHGAIYMARPDVNAIAHHHQRSVLPFTVTDLPLKPIFHMASVIGHEVPKWDSQPEFGDTNMLVDDLERGHSLAKVLGQGTAALLRGHGAVCVADNLAAVCFISVYLAVNAKVVLETLPHGTPTYLTKGEVEKAKKLLLGDMPLVRAWDYYKARAGFQGL